ncbi:phosphatase PAP2 family protein [Compostibacter hankyongensis]|uniref:Phosphatase PAP2 family protein n=1 Tax=Compostibacter hankyongensis TaxID=1007089 RepID=A0ABP8FZ34_9BACT
MQDLLKFDYRLFFVLNGHWHAPWLDTIFPFFRNPFFWAPLYLFLVLFMLINFRWRGWWWVLFFLLTFAVTDYTCGNIIKDLTLRMRPCNDPVMSQHTRSLVPCAGHHSFPSNHAANHFALAMFLFLTLRERFGRWMGLFFVWAFLVSYAQIYVGQHYPTDIVAGTALGLVIGTLTALFYNRRIGLPAAADEPEEYYGAG